MACTTNVINISENVNDTYKNIIDDSRVMLQIVASLMIVIYNRKMFIVLATALQYVKYLQINRIISVNIILS